MGNSRTLTYDEFKRMNSLQKFDELDYIHAIFKLNNLSLDLLFCFLKFLNPEFKIVNGLIFLNSRFDVEAYNSYLEEGRSSTEIQFWINLVEITGLFEEIDVDDAVAVANRIASLWNLSLKNSALNGAGIARVIIEKETSEVFVTIDQFKS